MSGNPTDNDPQPILQYAARLPNSDRQIVWPVTFGILQFPWIALFIYQALGWGGRPVEPVKDSLIDLLMLVPTIATFAVSFRYCRLHGLGRPIRFTVCLMLLLVSAAI